MLVREIMVQNVRTCTPYSDLQSVAMAMWDANCGAIPVIDDNNIPIGIITDRDIAMCCAINHKAPWQIGAAEIIQTKPVVTCGAKDNLKKALKVMKQNKIRRLPVVDAAGTLIGIISLDDVLSAKEFDQDFFLKDALPTVRSICVPVAH